MYDGGGGGMGGGGGTVASPADLKFESNGDTEGRVDVDVLGCTEVERVLNEVVRLSAVEVPATCWTWEYRSWSVSSVSTGLSEVAFPFDDSLCACGVLISRSFDRGWDCGEVFESQFSNRSSLSTAPGIHSSTKPRLALSLSEDPQESQGFSDTEDPLVKGQSGSFDVAECPPWGSFSSGLVTTSSAIFSLLSIAMFFVDSFGRVASVFSPLLQFSWIPLVIGSLDIDPGHISWFPILNSCLKGLSIDKSLFTKFPEKKKWKNDILVRCITFECNFILTLYSVTPRRD